VHNLIRVHEFVEANKTYLNKGENQRLSNCVFSLSRTKKKSPLVIKMNK